MTTIMFTGIAFYGNDYYEIKELQDGKQKHIGSWSVDSSGNIKNIKIDLQQNSVDVTALWQFFQHIRITYGNDIKLIVIFRESTIELEFSGDDFCINNTFWKKSGDKYNQKTISRVHQELWYQFQDVVINNYL